MKKSRLSGLGSALRTLTSIPWQFKESKDLSSSLPWFPVVGLFLGLLIYGIGLPWRLTPFINWTAGIALLMVATEVFLTRGLHLDGLADWADSFGGFLDREKRLEIMKDSSLGTFGVLALVLVLSAKWISLERMISSGSTIWLLAVFALSRDMMVDHVTSLPYARAENGMAGPFVKGASSRHRRISHAITLVSCMVYGPLGLVFFVFSWLVTWRFRLYCRTRFGGITGDLLGTANELIEVMLLLLCAWAGESVLFYTGWSWMVL